eukprot:364791-Chlamydomonas_euryale.AAC.13
MRSSCKTGWMDGCVGCGGGGSEVLGNGGAHQLAPPRVRRTGDTHCVVVHIPGRYPGYSRASCIAPCCVSSWGLVHCRPLRACLLDRAAACMPAEQGCCVHACWTGLLRACLLDRAAACMPAGQGCCVHACWTGLLRACLLNRAAACVRDAQGCCVHARRTGLLRSCLLSIAAACVPAAQGCRMTCNLCCVHAC